MKSFELLDSIELTPDQDWESPIAYKTMKLTSDLQVISLTGNDRTGARKCKGVYRWIYEDEIIYVGKAARSNNIAARQASHLANFKNPNLRSERSGIKLRRFLEDNNLKEIVITVEYLDMSKCKDSTVGAFEEACINYWNPILNFGE